MNTYKKIFCCIFLFSQAFSAPQYFCTAADSHYFNALLNLIASIHKTNFDNLVEIAVFDLGLTHTQLELLSTMQKVSIHTVEQVHPDILKPFLTSNWGKVVPGWYAWKPVVVKQALQLFPYVLWIDAGFTILKPIDNLFDYISQEGYFLCTIGDCLPYEKPSFPLSWGMTRYVREQFNLDHKNSWILEQPFVCASIFGVSREKSNLFLEVFYKLASNLNNFKDDGTTPNGFGTGRHDQTLLGIIAYINNLTIYQQDYTQKQPIALPLFGKNYDFYLTSDGKYVSDKTDIYHSRNNHMSYEDSLYSIKYK